MKGLSKRQLEGIITENIFKNQKRIKYIQKTKGDKFEERRRAQLK